MSAAFTLFGLSLIYGLSGALNLKQIAAALQGQGLDPLLVVAIVMTVIGFGFKVAAVPFISGRRTPIKARQRQAPPSSRRVRRWPVFSFSPK
jgi:hypothetical protein